MTTLLSAPSRTSFLMCHAPDLLKDSMPPQGGLFYDSSTVPCKLSLSRIMVRRICMGAFDAALSTTIQV
jgi:hypothetical protein